MLRLNQLGWLRLKVKDWMGTDGTNKWKANQSKIIKRAIGKSKKKKEKENHNNVKALPQTPPFSCEPAANAFFEQISQDGSTVRVHEQLASTSWAGRDPTSILLGNTIDGATAEEKQLWVSLVAYVLMIARGFLETPWDHGATAMIPPVGERNCGSGVSAGSGCGQHVSGPQVDLLGHKPSRRVHQCSRLSKVKLLDSCIANDYGFAMVSTGKWCCVFSTCDLQTNCSCSQDKGRFEEEPLQL